MMRWLCALPVKDFVMVAFYAAWTLGLITGAAICSLVMRMMHD
jgi:hypothetical protein